MFITFSRGRHFNLTPAARASYFASDVSFFRRLISEVACPIVTKLNFTTCSTVTLIYKGQKFGFPQKIGGPNTFKKSAGFGTTL